MTENTLVRDFLKLARPELEDRDRGVLIKLADARTSGIPDMIFSLHARSTWWEAKLAKPLIVGTGLQHLTARRLAAASECWYIVYQTIPVTRTCLVRPCDVRDDGTFDTDQWTVGIDHDFVIGFMRARHRV